MTGLTLRKINSAVFDPDNRSMGKVRSFLLAMFFVGLVFGFFVGISADGEGIQLRLSDINGGLARAWVFFILLLVFSTSFLGLALIPALICVRGFLFSCCVAVLCISMGIHGVLLSLLGSALPLCFLLPCYVLVGEDCFRLSRRCAELLLGRGGYCGEIFPLRHLLAMLLLIIFDALYSVYLLPALI